ncbi:MAG TPA: drug/metabolite exporter YedA [Noviherbaspirillum sp.]|uniref:drug/metabolite exporter YedA n=1 Tax=Noviherbaspirillum sp. TaxID=1926288 RepID=UPI002D35F803|nr:drug/metabolite exporter YedA [Noviherbaspirillum sp.]HYD97578.1 drug/metabolite exporter YedA [Noviherbaspirillum sp.]
MKTLPKPVLLALLTVYLVWGSTYLAIRFALLSFPPFLLMGTRFLVAGTVLYLWLALRGNPAPNLRQWRDGAVVGVLLLGGGMGLTAVAQQYVSSGMTAVFIAAAPLMFALWAGLFGDWPGPREWTGIVIGFGGAALLAGGGEFRAQPAGVLALAGAVTCWTFGSVLSQKKLALAPGAMGFASEMLAGGAFLVVAGWLQGERLGASFDSRALLAWGYLVTAGSLAAFSAYMYLLSKVKPALASSYAYVNPVIAVLLGVGLAGETLGARELLSMAIILGSVILLTTAKATPKNTNASAAASAASSTT